MHVVRREEVQTSQTAGDLTERVVRAQVDWSNDAHGVIQVVLYSGIFPVTH